MCGRYTLFTDEDSAEINRIIEQVNRKYPENNFKTGEIFPTNSAPVLVQEKSSLSPTLMNWGFPHFKGSGVIINARAETAEEKRMFRESLKQRRCVIPSTGFYEWKQDQTKQKYLFRLPHLNVLYMAGIYNVFKGEPRYVILTTEANSSIADVHHRMPVVLPQDKLMDWVFDENKAAEIAQDIPPMLEKQPAEHIPRS